MDDSTIDKMIGQYQNNVELEQYAAALVKANQQLQKKLSLSEQKNKELEQMLTAMTPTIVQTPSEAKHLLTLSDEEAICRMQLKLLHDKSLGRELTLEETKKVEILTKLLVTMAAKNPKEDEAPTAISTEELLKLVSDVETK